jgi:hypothetical protein
MQQRQWTRRLGWVLVAAMAFLGLQAVARALTFSSGPLQPGIADTVVERSVGVPLMPPATETIVAGASITANACNTLKRLTAAGAVTTSATETFTAPAVAPPGCIMFLCNVGANAITLDVNANFKASGGAVVVLGADDCTTVVNDGTVWRSLSGVIAN